jgi:restriction endonuclease Mrr
VPDERVTAALEDLHKRAEATRKLHDEIQKMLTASENQKGREDRVLWGEWLNNMSLDIHPSLWARYLRGTFDLVMDLTSWSETVKATEELELNNTSAQANDDSYYEC